MQASNQTREPIWPVVARLFRTAGLLRFWFFVALVIDLVQAAFVVLNNDLIRRVFDSVSAANLQAFWLFVSLSLGLGILSFPLTYTKSRSIGLFSERTLTRLRQAAARRSANLPIAELEKRHSGDMLSLLNADMGKLKGLLSNNLLDLVGLSVRGLAAFAYIISINWILALSATILTPLIFILISNITQPVTKRSEEMQAEIGQVNSQAQDALSGALVVKAFNLEGQLGQRFHQANQAALKKGLEIARLRSLIDGITLPMAIVPFFFAIGLGGYFIMQKQITFGAMFAFINLLNYVVNPLAALPGVIASIGEASGAARRVFDLLDQPAERTDGQVTAAPAQTAAPALEVNQLSFAYQDGEPILNNISFTAASGQKIAIVGPSGGGKSTLVKILLGYYALPDGKYRLLGSDINQWNLAAARQQMSFVAQDTYLFPVSIGENIRLGRPDASQEMVEQAARLANIHNFIQNLPDGYQSQAGEWGGRLSGGQKQRISLARAILKDAPILLLDEPTSALDAESETLIQQSLQHFAANRTTVVIAHRLSTIRDADQIIVLQDGAIAQQGTHAELAARGGLYLDLYQHQFGQAAANGGAL